MGDAVLDRMRKSRLGLLILTGSLLVAALAACGSPVDTTWERLEETRTLRVGMDASFPPFASITPDGALAGLDVDLAWEISERLGFQPRFVPNLPYDGLYDALTADHVDVVISALPVDPSRTEDYAYSRPYFDAGQVLVVGTGQEEIASVSDLGGRRLAVVLGTVGDREGRRWARRLAGLVVIQYRTPREALQAVVQGETEAALVDHVSALDAMADEDGLTTVGDPVIEVPYACAMRRDSVQLLDAVNEALAAMEDDGTMEALIAKWLR
jgi:ABC-type amino acid transport substrate-binding protein